MAAARFQCSSSLSSIFTVVLLSLCMWPGRAQECNYAASCTSVSFSTTTGLPLLTASCPNCNGVVLTTAAIDLNQRVENNDGALECDATGGNFAYSCSDIALSGSTLSATCLTIDGTSSSATIDLNNCIGNINGNLIWCVGTGPCSGMASSVLLRNSTESASPGTGCTAKANITLTTASTV